MGGVREVNAEPPGRRRGLPARLTVVGIVGRIGAGKSTVAGMLEDLGAEVVDADRIAHEVLADAAVRGAVRRRFGSGVFRADGTIDRQALARVVFGPDGVHAGALRDLEAIVHPPVHEQIAARLAAAAAAAVGAESSRVIVLDVPLLVKSGWVDACDVIVLLACDDATRHRRLGERFPKDQIAAREAAWNLHPPTGLPEEKTVTVDTSGDRAYTRRQVERIWLERLGGG